MDTRLILLIILIFIISSTFIFSQYLYLSQFIENENLTLLWNHITGTGVIKKENNYVSFMLDVPWIMFNYKEIYHTEAIIRKDHTVMVHEKTVFKINSFFKQKEKEKEIPCVAYILIDPGHGGKDPGAYYTHKIGGEKITLYEKNLTLKISIKLYNMLKKRFPQKKIILTRANDTYIKLEDRVDIANSMKVGEYEAVVYISIHFNASFNRNANGFEVWYLPQDYRRKLLKEENASEDEKEILPILNTMLEEEYTMESITLAQDILNQLNYMIGKKTENRGLKEEAWFVVRNTRMPSVLLELGFISNKEEAILLNDDSYLNILSNGIYNGICIFIERFERTRGFTK